MGRPALEKAVGIAPQEPAGWALRGLLEVRQGHTDEGAAALAKAAELAPESAAIAALQGLAESRRGKLDEAIAHYRRAVLLDAKNLRYRYALMQALDTRGTRESDQESLQLIDELSGLAPENQAVLTERVRVAAKIADATRFHAGVAALRARAKDWPPDALEELAELEKGPGGPEAATRVLFIQQALQAHPPYRQGLIELSGPRDVVGEPTERFLKLPAPVPAPAPPDEALAFTVSVKGPACQAVSVVLSPLASGVPALAPQDARCAVADLDGDSNQDVAVFRASGLAALKGDAKLEVVPQTTYPGAFAAGWAADVELDGDLDLIAGAVAGPTVVYRNGGDGKLEAVLANPFAAVKDARELAWADLDGEGTPDAAFVDATGALTVFLNRRGGKFDVVAPPPGAPLAAITIADTDADGHLELVGLARDGTLRRATRTGTTWTTHEIGRGPANARVLFAADLDNNGAVDLVAATAAATTLLVNDGKAFRPGNAPADFAAEAAVDLDGDGLLDLAGRSAKGELATAKAKGMKGYHWIALRPRGNPQAQGDKRINTFGLGGLIQVRAGLLVQDQVIASPVVHFGLGLEKGVDGARTVWPNGTLDGEYALATDASLAAEQRLKGSCPWVFAWNGRAMGFVTDFLWRSPLGLRINGEDTAGVAQTEDRVKIRGDQLVPRDGAYDVRITAELWETHFVDQLALLVVDHAPGTAVFVDERFVPRAPPALDVRAVTDFTPVTAARDDRGRDVSGEAHARDSVYVPLELGAYQGLTGDHWVELPAPRPDQAWLVAYGWIQPTDSSLNVAIAQARGPAPRGLSLEAQDPDGTWRVLEPDLGFPAGKNKTVLIPVLSARGRPVRLRTNLEIYWDQLAYARAAPEPRIARLAPRTAKLVDRGFSRVTRASRGAPELPDYGTRIGRGARWRDLEGFHTRFGDVLELVRAVDDRYVIMNAGDELCTTFAALPPAAGLERDFVLVGDGWEKDGDYNTAFSRTVLPLPSHDAPAYDRTPGPLLLDPVYRRHARDWRTYHTRYVTPERFARGLR